MSTSLGIRKQVEKKVKANLETYEASKAKARGELNRALANFKTHREANLQALKQICLMNCECETEDLDLQAEAAMKAADELVHAIDECNSNIKEAVVQAVADILGDESREGGRRAWGLSMRLHDSLGDSVSIWGDVWR